MSYHDHSYSLFVCTPLPLAAPLVPHAACVDVWTYLRLSSFLPSSLPRPQVKDALKRSPDASSVAYQPAHWQTLIPGSCGWKDGDFEKYGHQSGPSTAARLMLVFNTSVLTGLAVTLTTSAFTNARTHIMSNPVRHTPASVSVSALAVALASANLRNQGSMLTVGPSPVFSRDSRAPGHPLILSLVLSRAPSQGKYNSMLHCLMDIVRMHGPLGLYRGFFAQWARFGPYATVQFLVWEQLRFLCGLPGL